MIRTGYLRWEIEAEDRRSPVDVQAREVILRARPSYRRVLVRSLRDITAAEQFLNGEANYDSVLRSRRRPAPDCEIRLPDVGPVLMRYSERDRASLPRFWMEKLQRTIENFAHDVVRAASAFPQLVISSPALRAGYARLVQQETFRVIEGKSQPQPTEENEPMRIEPAAYAQGVPELVAAELVRDVVEPAEFHEFCQFDMLTVKNGDKYYRIPRRPHGLVQVWDATTRLPIASLCVIFQDPGMPPSDEIVMKYLLAKHQPELLWKIGVRYNPPRGKFEQAAPRRWSL